MKIHARAKRAPVKLLAEVPEIKPQAAPRPSTKIAKNATLPQLLAQAAALSEAKLETEAKRACWAAVRKRNPDVPLDIQPTDDAQGAALHQVLAEALHLARDHRPAATAARRSLDLDPGALQGWFLWALSLRLAGAWEESVEAATEGLTAHPWNPDLLSILADGLFDLGYPETAAAKAREALAAVDGGGVVACWAGKTLARAGLYDQAFPAWRRAARGLGGTEAARELTAIGHYLCAVGRYENAITHYQQAVDQQAREGEAGNQDALNGLINAHHALGAEMDAHQVRLRLVEQLAGSRPPAMDFYFPIHLAPLGDGRPGDPVEPGRAVLVGAIGVLPSIPLGIAAIKAYVESESDWRVTAVDLNALHFKQVVQALCEGKRGFTINDMDEARRAFEAASAGHPDFFREETHAGHSRQISRVLSFIQKSFNTAFKQAFEQTGPAPWYILDYVRHLLGARPQLVGFSINFTEQLYSALVCARMLKALSPATVTVFGGSFFKAANLEGFLAEASVDYLVLNEGELSCLRLINYLNGEGALEDVPGLAYREPESGEFHVRDNDLSLRLDQIPYPDFSDLDLTAYYKPAAVFPILGSRGCYWRRCTFCNHFSSYANTFKAASIERVVDELAHHAAGGVRHFTFVDEMISAKRFKKIGEAILARGLEINYFALAKPTDDFTPEILDIMRRSGCRCIYWGVESGSAKMLRMMDKGNSVEGSARTLEYAHRAGINNHLFLIVGFPGETRDDLDQTLDFLYRNRKYVHSINSGAFVLEPGTPLHDNHRRFGIRKIHPVRSLSSHLMSDFEIEGAIGQKLAERYNTILGLHYFDHFSRWGRFFGTPRDYVITVYSERPDLPAEDHPRVPHPDSVRPLLDDPDQAGGESGERIEMRWDYSNEAGPG